jgi:uncharacterized protein DUF6188
MLPVMGAGRRPRQALSIDLLTGRRLESVRLGDTIVLSFTGGCQVLTEAPAHLDAPADVDPADDPADALATLLGDVVGEARTRDDGELRITFASGSVLCVDVDAEYESWAVTGPDGFLIVCLAQGELALWGSAKHPA